jgi:hypothetical protein
MNAFFLQLSNMYQPNRYQMLLTFPLLLHFINVHYISNVSFQKNMFGFTTGSFTMIFCKYLDYCIKDI